MYFSSLPVAPVGAWPHVGSVELCYARRSQFVADLHVVRARRHELLHASFVGDVHDHVATLVGYELQPVVRSRFLDDASSPISAFLRCPEQDVSRFVRHDAASALELSPRSARSTVHPDFRTVRSRFPFVDLHVDAYGLREPGNVIDDLVSCYDHGDASPKNFGAVT